MPLELKFDVKADEHGVFDGRELAQELIGTAYRLLAPYVHACPACTDTLFTVIANRVIDQLHQLTRIMQRIEPHATQSAAFA